jgi:hypothetical protein
MTVKKRLIEFAKSQERSVRAFESKAGLNEGYINSIRVSIQPDKLQSIASNYPNLNTDWLMTGNGTMLKEQLNLDVNDSNKPLSINDLVKAINNLSEAAIVNANAAMKNAESNDRYSKNMERMLDMLSGSNIPSQKRDVKPKSPGIDDAAETA